MEKKYLEQQRQDLLRQSQQILNQKQLDQNMMREDAIQKILEKMK